MSSGSVRTELLHLSSNRPSAERKHLAADASRRVAGLLI